MKISNIVLKLIQTEKSNTLNANSIYTFKVLDSANKYSIKEEIERVFSVDVLKVWTSILPNKPKLAFSTKKDRRPKRIRVGRFKKAIVKLKEGQSILSESVKGEK